ncbi:MAG: hypothetical protein IT172_11125 [Acidobacteria bacterium]|nr:hypothetical protein [Acidobacteriota bacterium]
MKRILTVVMFLVCPAAGIAQSPRVHRAAAVPPAVKTINVASVLPIRRVILYSNGVAYIERRGIVNGNAKVDLSFKQSQVDDVLKSMVVLDLGQGKIGAVSYNSSQPAAARMTEIPFSVAAVAGDGSGLSSVLSQLQGSKIAVVSSKGNAAGSILNIERKQVKTDKDTRITSVLTIVSENGELSSFDLADVRSVKLIDDNARKDIHDFADAAASARRLDAKTITVTSQGAGQREMVVSYTIAAPIWKTTYRVVLDKEGKPFFQGWAIVDNVSDEDWQNVEMSLVSGSPISFIQPLQQPLYRYRPIARPPQDLQISPQVYEPEGPAKDGSGSGTIDSSESKIQTNLKQKLADSLPKGTTFTSPLKGSAKVRGEALAGGFQTDGASGSENVWIIDGKEVSNVRTGILNSNNSIAAADGPRTSVSDALVNTRSGVDTAAKGADIGDMFEYRISQAVTVEKDRSALIPIIQTKMDGERVAIYNEAVRADRPLSGVRLTNGTGLTLESGSITVIDGDAYAGESLMERLKPQEQRLISFATDLGTHVRVRTEADSEPAKLIKAVDGVFQVHYFRGERKKYEISNQTDKPKTLYIEYPVRDGWELDKDGPQPDYTTQRYYRFRVSLGPLEEKAVTISLRRPLMDSYDLTRVTKNDLAIFLRGGYLNDAVKAKLQRLVEIGAELAEIDSKSGALDDEIEKVEDDQKRLRENIEALSKTPEAKVLITRYVAKAGEQETRLEAIEKEQKELSERRIQLLKEQASEIRNFNVN